MAIKVQSGRLSNFSGTVSVSVEAYDPDHTFCVVQGRATAASNPDDWAVRINSNLGGDNESISIQNFDNQGEATWWVVEATAGEFSVQKLQGTMTGVSSATASVSAVDLSRTEVYCSARLAGTSSNFRQEAAAAYVRAYMSNTTTLQVNRYDVFEAGTAWAAYVVEWASATDVEVASGTDSTSFDGSSPGFISVPSPVVDDSLDFLHTTVGHETPSLEGVSVVYTLLEDPTNSIAYSRFNTTTSSQSPVAWFLTRFPSGRGITVATKTASFVASGATEVLTLPSSVKADSSFIWLSSSCDGDGTAYPRHLWTAEFTSIDGSGMTSEVTVDRDYTGQPGFVTVSVVDFSQSTLITEGAATGTFGAITAAGVGNASANDIDSDTTGSFGSITAAATAAQVFEAAATGTFGAITAAGVGTTLSGSATGTFGSITATSTAEVAITATATGTFGAITAVGAGQTAFSGSATGAFGAIVASSVASQDFTALTTGAFGAITADSLATTAYDATATGTFGSITAASTATLDFTTSATGAFGAITAAGVASLGLTGSGTGTFGAITSDGLGALSFVTTGTGVFGSVTAASTAQAGDNIAGAGTGAFGSIAATGVASTLSGLATGTFGAITATGTGSTLSGTGTGAFGSIAAAGVAIEAFPATATGTFGSIAAASVASALVDVAPFFGVVAGVVVQPGTQAGVVVQTGTQAGAVNLLGTQAGACSLSGPQQGALEILPPYFATVAIISDAHRSLPVTGTVDSCKRLVVDLCVVRGDDGRSIQFTFYDDEAKTQPTDWTGASAKLVVDTDPAPSDTSNNLFEITGVISAPTTGVLVFTPSKANSLQDPGVYFYDVQVTLSSGAHVTVAKGQWTVEADIADAGS